MFYACHYIEWIFITLKTTEGEFEDRVVFKISRSPPTGGSLEMTDQDCHAC